MLVEDLRESLKPEAVNVAPSGSGDGPSQTLSVKQGQQHADVLPLIHKKGL